MGVDVRMWGWDLGDRLNELSGEIGVRLGVREAARLEGRAVERIGVGFGRQSMYSEPLLPIE